MAEGVAIAVASGMLAAVNPCGFALLPAYLALLLVDDRDGRATAVGRALGLSAVMTGAFVAVFGVFGLVVAPLVPTVQEHLPWVTLAVGVVLLGLGLWLIAGRQITGLPLMRGAAGPRVGSVPAMAAYGVSYALASLSCTIAPFLAVVVATFRSGSALAASALFAIYGLGMGIVVSTAAVAVVLARTSVLVWMRRFSAALPRFAGALLIVAGIYVVSYGAWEIRVLRGYLREDPVISFAESIQVRLAAAVNGLGWLGFTVILLVLVAGTVVVRRLRPRLTPARTEPGTPDDKESSG